MNINRWICLAIMIFQGLRTVQLQHILTLLTMMMGALALSATLFSGEGALNGLWADLDRMMGDEVIVYPDCGSGRELLKKRGDIALTFDDLRAVQNRIPEARYVLPRYFGEARVESGGREIRLSVDGIPPELEKEPAFQRITGSSFSEEAWRGDNYECWLTQSALARFNLPIKNQPKIRIGCQRFTVVGTVADPPEADERFRVRVIIPYGVSQLLWGKPGVIPNLVVAWKQPKDMDLVMTRLRQTLDECRAKDAYYLSSSQMTIRKRKKIVANFMVFGSIQALFCIIVASIGVVNVMIANVIRRSREFAIRTAMGALPDDLMLWVLGESLFIGFLGAVLGILAGIILSPPLCHLIAQRVPEASQLQPYFGLKGIILPILVCSAGGLTAGIIPSLRVRKLDILGILRAE